MMRSFAPTLAAVTLRLDPTVLELADLPFVAGYQAVSFLCWVPKLLLAEWLIRRMNRQA